MKIGKLILTAFAAFGINATVIQPAFAVPREIGDYKSSNAQKIFVNNVAYYLNRQNGVVSYTP